VENYHNRKHKVKVFDTPRRKIVAFSFILYYPIISTLVGAPLPFPSLIDVSSAHVAFVNFLSLLVTLVGSIIGIGFYIERRNNLKFDQQNTKMDRIDNKIDDKGNWLYNAMREMEGRLCQNFDTKIQNLEKSMDVKVDKAKDLEDERLKRIDEGHREHGRRLDRIDQNLYSYDKRSINKSGGLE
jgi:hypothetical protein